MDYRPVVDATLGSATQLGFLAAAAAALGTLAIFWIPKYKWVAAGVLLTVLTPLALLGFWFSPGPLGISDWDQYFTYHHHLRRTIFEFGQFPFWDPWLCGGTAALGDPEFPVFTPTFLLELIFGVPTGLRLAIYLSTAVGALGTLLLARRLRLSVYAATVAALAVTFGSVNLLEIVEGHTNIFAAMYIPWIFWAWLGAYRQSRATNKWTLVLGILLALTFYQGGIYLLSYTAAAFLVLIFLSARRRHAFLIILLAGLLALGLAGIKLIPTIAWLSQFPDKNYASSAFTLFDLHKILLGRHLHGAQSKIPNQGSGWHEYGAYLGPFVLALAALGVTRLRQHAVKALVIATVLAVYVSSSGPLLQPLFDRLPVIPRSNISRVILFAVVPIALLAGFGLDGVRKFASRGRMGFVVAAAITIMLVTLISANLFTLSSQLSFQAFVLPYPVPDIAPAPLPIAHTAHPYRMNYLDAHYNRGYAAALAGYGTQAYCSVLGAKPAVRTIHDEDNFGPVLDNENVHIDSVDWTPNRVTTRVTAASQADVMLNTNYARGWSGGREMGNRVGITVEPGTHVLTFAYRSPGFTAGAWLTAGTLLTIILYAPVRRMWMSRRTRRKMSAPLP